MIYFWLTFSIGLNVLFLIFLLYLFDQKEFWRKKFLDQLERIYPITWDYTKQKGWTGDEAEEE